jgi:hypothetical protein
LWQPCLPLHSSPSVRLSLRLLLPVPLPAWLPASLCTHSPEGHHALHYPNPFTLPGTQKTSL